LPPTASRTFGISGLSCGLAGLISAAAATAMTADKACFIVVSSLTQRWI
jgi:hypothetical protein